MASRSQSVWIVQGKENSGGRLSIALQKLGVAVQLLPSLEEAKSVLRTHQPSLVFIEGVPDQATISLMERFQEMSPQSLLVSLISFDNPARLRTLVSNLLLETTFGNKVSSDSIDNVYRLSVREREVLQLMVKGLINKEIAEAISISYYTVENHQRKIYEKLKVHTRTAAVTKALLEKIVQTA